VRSRLRREVGMTIRAVALAIYCSIRERLDACATEKRKKRIALLREARLDDYTLNPLLHVLIVF
jgi:hypothetical protein